MTDGTPFIRERHAERFRFDNPVAALFGSHPVVLSDLSLSGAGIVHRQQFVREESHSLAFSWEGTRIELPSVVVRTSLERQLHGGIALTLYHSGLAFGPEESSASMNALATRLGEALARQHANAFAISLESARRLPLLSFDAEESRPDAPPVNLNDFFVTESGVRRFVQCRLVHDCWVHENVEALEQPEDGFTISATESVEELAKLCLTYQHSDQQGRNLIRTFAHLTLTEPADTPRNLYIP